MAQGFSLADQTFNAESVGRLAAEYAAAIEGFDQDVFVSKVLSGFPEREFMQRVEWIADCLEPYLAEDFSTMASQLKEAMPEKLNPLLKDDDFGSFVHTVPGVLAVRHGLENHHEEALDLLYEATQRFSMEFYIRPFINQWPDDTLARMKLWAEDENYHVRRLVSEGLRPKLPWAKKLEISQDTPLPYLDALYADQTRFVTRSVSNHLNDISKSDPDVVVQTLAKWRDEGLQNAKEMDWMTRHALRGLIKQGHQGALELLGFKYDADVNLEGLKLKSEHIKGGEALEFEVALSAKEKTPVIVDYQIHFVRQYGSTSPKVFKLKQTNLAAGKPILFAKRHVLKANATTFRLYEGRHKLVIQVNGKPLGEAEFDLALD